MICVREDGLDNTRCRSGDNVCIGGCIVPLMSYASETVRAKRARKTTTIGCPLFVCGQDPQLPTGGKFVGYEPLYVAIYCRTHRMKRVTVDHVPTAKCFCSHRSPSASQVQLFVAWCCHEVSATPVKEHSTARFFCKLACLFG